MEITAVDFTPWGLAAEWPSLRWLEPVHGRRAAPARGIRLGHASESAMVLTCTFPRASIDAEALAAGIDPVREIAFETTYAQVNLALHQVRTGERPEGLIGDLLSYASRQADRYQEWAAASWGDAAASTTELASWQSGFSLDYPEVYVVVHACGTGIDALELTPAEDLSGYETGGDPTDVAAMHWELWRSHPHLDYGDLAPLVAG